MAVYPLSAAEDRVIRWMVRVIPAVSVVIILLLGAATIA